MRVRCDEHTVRSYNFWYFRTCCRGGVFPPVHPTPPVPPTQTNAILTLLRGRENPAPTSFCAVSVIIAFCLFMTAFVIRCLTQNFMLRNTHRRRAKFAPSTAAAVPLPRKRWRLGGLIPMVVRLFFRLSFASFVYCFCVRCSVKLGVEYHHTIFAARYTFFCIRRLPRAALHAFLFPQSRLSAKR